MIRDQPERTEEHLVVVPEGERLRETVDRFQLEDRHLDLIEIRGGEVREETLDPVETLQSEVEVGIHFEESTRPPRVVLGDVLRRESLSDSFHREFQKGASFAATLFFVIHVDPYSQRRSGWG